VCRDWERASRGSQWRTRAPSESGLKNSAWDFLSHAVAHEGKGFSGVEIMKFTIQAESFDSGPSY
jgi:hypothetical protein